MKYQILKKGDVYLVGGSRHVISLLLSETSFVKISSKCVYVFDSVKRTWVDEDDPKVLTYGDKDEQ